MKKLAHHSMGAMAAIAALFAVNSQGQLIDDFSGSLAPYSDVRILNNGNHVPGNTYSWQINAGALQLATTTFIGIEQFALTRTDATLDIGEEMIAEFTPGYTGTQDIGLYVGAGTPTTDVRANYVNVYVRNNGQVFSRGFNGAVEFALSGGATPADIDYLFIARTGVDTFQLGYYDNNNRNLLTTRVIGAANAVGVGSAIGFYGDVRAVGIVGIMDNLQITTIPEPSSAALLGIGTAAFLLRLRRRS